MAYRDLRSFLDDLRRTGDLLDGAEEEDWDLGLGAMPRGGAGRGPPDLPLRDLHREYEALLARPPLEPIVVDDAPCKMVKITGEDIDLFRFPAPMLHEGDGGRYIGTWDIVVTRDIDDSHTNWGTYRFMLHTEDLLAGWPGPLSHLGRGLRQQYLPPEG